MREDFLTVDGNMILVADMLTFPSRSGAIAVRALQQYISRRMRTQRKGTEPSETVETEIIIIRTSMWKTWARCGAISWVTSEGTYLTTNAGATRR